MATYKATDTYEELCEKFIIGRDGQLLFLETGRVLDELQSFRCRNRSYSTRVVRYALVNQLPYQIASRLLNNAKGSNSHNKRVRKGRICFHVYLPPPMLNELSYRAALRGLSTVAYFEEILEIHLCQASPLTNPHEFASFSSSATAEPEKPLPSPPSSPPDTSSASSISTTD